MRESEAAFYVALLTMAGGGLGFLGKLLIDRWLARRDDRLALDKSALATFAETARDQADVIDVLRIALDRGRIRENAYVTIVELLLHEFRRCPDTPDVIASRTRCAEILAEARRHTASAVAGAAGANG